MRWIEQMQPGSFRGVPFYTQSADGQLGRRIALHEYPGRDLPYAEDLGKAAGQFTLELIVVGKDYMAQRDALITALEAPGPDTLVHPWRGSLRVAVLSARGPKESTRQGGMASFSVTFVEAGEAVEPAAKPDTRAAVRAHTMSANAALQKALAEQLDVSGPEFVADAAWSQLQQAADRFNQLSRQIAVPGQLAADFVDDTAALTGELTSLLRAPGDLASRMIGLVQDLGRLAEKPLGAVEIYKLLFSWGDDALPVPTSTPTRRQQAVNQAAISALVRRAALVGAIEQSADHDYQSTDQAVAMRDTLTEQIDRETETADDALYYELVDLRVALVRDIAARGLVLPRIVRYTPPVTLPAILLAYRLHGDPEREADLIARNQVQHPGFIPGGTALEILSDG